jgi:hypothetical protein
VSGYLLAFARYLRDEPVDRAHSAGNSAHDLHPYVDSIRRYRTAFRGIALGLTELCRKGEAVATGGDSGDDPGDGGGYVDKPRCATALGIFPSYLFLLPTLTVM